LLLTPHLISAAQLPQTAYQSLLTPYSFIGLGRTNNYVENLFVGSTLHSNEHFINMEGVIPNSKVVFKPPPVVDGILQGSWKKELYLRPGEWIPWVTVAVVATTVLLAGVVGLLHLGEKVCHRVSSG
jgi:integrin alpha FG-GAP repeat containing protein 1